MSDSFVCQRCGHCCMTAFLALNNVPISKDRKEIARYFSLHHCEPMIYPADNGAVLALKIPLVCKWLEYDEEKKVYRCKDYEHRPVVCREYFCKRAMDTRVTELAK